MASYKSQSNLPRRVEQPSPYAHRAGTSRLPQKSVAPTPSLASQLPAPGHSKLQKKQTTGDAPVFASRIVIGRGVPMVKPAGATRGRQGSTPTVHTPSVPSHVRIADTLSQVSSSRLPKSELLASTRTPSLATGSSTSTIGSPRSNVLRRKPSSIGIAKANQPSQRRVNSMSSQEEGQSSNALPGVFKDPFSETVLGISLPATSSILTRSDPQVEIQGDTSHEYEIGPTEILTLPTPQYALSTTPSTRYSESPGPFSVSSTPTSMSSYSPGVVLSSKTRVRQASPLQGRPPLARQNTPDDSRIRPQRGLSSVRESSTSSSSTSTVVADGPRSKDAQVSQRLAPPPPSPQSKIGSQRQVPPELAHLADNRPVPATGARRPIRPSRNGTAEIVGLREPSPIIQSNMASFPSSHRRTSSTDSKMAGTMSSRARFGLPSKSSSRNPSPSLSVASPPLPGSRVPTREPTPDVYSDVDTQRQQTLPPSQTTAPSPEKTSRFGFFRRKTEPPPTNKPEKKLHRRGPAAGTGHEGYGRYALRGRSGSSMSSIGRSTSAGTTTESLHRTPSSRKSSFTSTASTDVDDFFLERLAPVTIRGTGNSTEVLASPDSIRGSTSLEISHSVGDGTQRPRNTPGVNLEQKKPTLLPSAMSEPVRGASPLKRMPLGPRRPSESDDDTKRSFLPSLTTRRASRASKIMDGGPLSKVVSSGSVTDKGSKSKSSKTKAEKATSKASRKWNFFQRAQATSKADPRPVEPAPVSGAHPSKSVAHYALIDAPTGIDMEDIERIMQEADNASDDVPTPQEPLNDHLSVPVAEPKARLQSMLLPPKPIFPSHLATTNRPSSPKVYLRREMSPKPSQPSLTVVTDAETVAIPPPPLSHGELTPLTDLSPPSSPFRPLSPVEPSEPPVAAPSSSEFVLPDTFPPPGPPPATLPPRPSRLAQVGRIPQVVSRRQDEHRPLSRSFSRPFINGSPHQHVPRTSFDTASPLSVTAGPVEPYPVLHGLDPLSHGLAIATLSPSAEASNRQSEFFKFPPRKDSEVSYSSSSGAWSFLPPSGTAVVPATGAPQSEDEIWREYDDLIDEVLSPLEVGAGAGDKETFSRHPSLEPLPLKTRDPLLSAHPEVATCGPSNPSLHLRRSRLLAVLHSAQSPTSPMSLSDFIQDYPDRRLSVVDPVTGRLSLPTSSRMSTGSVPQKRPNSTRSSLPASLSLSARQSRATIASKSDRNRASANSNRYRDTRLMEMAENQSDGLVSMANLRFGALMTSKWLSFGRVLFSPAHFELKDPAQDRVLVIDGLGKDWSYYCALTYPEASVYNLGPGMSSSNTSGASEPWSTLRNHHHVCHENLSAPFPYPRGFFGCVVLRFPPALPSAVHRFVISECKRVLRPGGHLEFSVLDLDLVNMGNRARRAIRGLKVKMQVADENVSLRNISDEIMAALGRKGFVGCNRCFVGVPVAGRLPNPDDGESSDGKKRKGSTASSLDKPKGTPRQAKAPKPEVSFSDLLNKHSSTGSTDDGIADMVARVGRWWYSRCYESLVLPEASEPNAAAAGNLLENSIWRDEALINECEKRGTTFRLLIGYAQKPEVGVRRTVSV
ncbi:uncharacterized protein EI97DRAFT_502292 [Westerdykella ornata]|uniref:Methyltransferase type 11 domain-containing protein n=1 Tax=Westerdykella ornata TaxID=318751 RepID=A0A6A6JER2_WESOR|nr:uncharacterized protein EI97DRAFT_502292 [Westerdykella ornata]KAF2275051.1 hypothetical protein EI97DRAFT_502292 [Westerdykella ornata]